ncbi:hypothetical protein Godav_009188 [Gossypium davidsonii]|uniref:RNase H type-1 domain-containing protein n=1 Tax=Gossypium davidsonii TaxID=34287 RepID=A0A7J8SDV1_GOSDV|nr:hypothetical protein [Gossypium davidsonii]
MTLVSWNSVCQPKTRGGLEFLQLKDQNTSFLLKLGFNILSSSETLWVCVLRAKYGIKDDIPLNIVRSNCSFLWRALSKVWPLLRENIFWLVGDGNSIKCWRDNWIPEIDPLINLIPASANIATGASLVFFLHILQQGLTKLLGWKPLLDASLLKVLIVRLRRVCGILGRKLGICHGRLKDLKECLIRGHGAEDVLHVLRDCDAASNKRLSKFSTVGIINALQLAREALLLDLPRERRWQKQKEINIEIGYLAIIEDWGNVRFFEAKLWGILDGVALAQGRQHDRVLVQKDNMEVMGTIKESLSKGSNYALIRCILQLLQNEKVWSIEHIPRDENMKTDSIPKIAFGREEGLQIFETSPLVPF